jgi:hypothetical protein
MRSNVYRLLVSRERAPIAHHPLTITYNYKLSVRLTKMRFAYKNSKNLFSV